MIILFEDYAYRPQDLPQLEGIEPTELRNGMLKFSYVGYYYEAASGEMVFILPKVLIVEGKAIGRYEPERLLAWGVGNEPIASADAAVLFELSVWIYEAVARFNKRHMDNEITSRRTMVGVASHRGDDGATLLDHILALTRYNSEHQSLFTYIASVMHSGLRNIHWAKTIRTTAPIGSKNRPFYVDCLAKEKTINFDEELICLFYSTLNYLKYAYCVAAQCNVNYPIEKPHCVADLIASGKGTRRLRKIRGKYFTNELVRLWNILYAFYDRAERVARAKRSCERLLVRNFNIVFEDMIDCLIGDARMPKGVKAQKDGKLVDHIYKDQSVVDGESIYFIGDSKYYRSRGAFGENVMYKQFTYARNVIQYHIDIFNGFLDGEQLRYRDELTEGYNPTPNFFIRGMVDISDLSFGDSKLRQDSRRRCLNVHFNNRLFDRDTLFVLVYDINFLYVLAAYVQDRGYSMGIKRELRSRFREDIIRAFEDEYQFYVVRPRRQSNEEFVARHFKKIVGKIYQTANRKLILALSKRDEASNAQLVAFLRSSAWLEATELKRIAGMAALPEGES